MREIKFRYVYQNIENPENFYFLYLNIEDIEDIIIAENKSRNDGWKLISRDVYTDLNDKNKKKIYECDIVKYNIVGTNKVKWVNKIIWKNGCLIINDEDTPPLEDEKGVIYNIELIGNIYKNPELLKEIPYYQN